MSRRHIIPSREIDFCDIEGDKTHNGAFSLLKLLWTCVSGINITLKNEKPYYVNCSCKKSE